MQLYNKIIFKKIYKIYRTLMLFLMNDYYSLIIHKLKSHV